MPLDFQLCQDQKAITPVSRKYTFIRHYDMFSMVLNSFKYVSSLIFAITYIQIFLTLFL